MSLVKNHRCRLHNRMQASELVLLLLLFLSFWFIIIFPPFHYIASRSVQDLYRWVLHTGRFIHP
jgi:hypothetical protein